MEPWEKETALRGLTQKRANKKILKKDSWMNGVLVLKLLAFKESLRSCVVIHTSTEAWIHNINEFVAPELLLRAVLLQAA